MTITEKLNSMNNTDYKVDLDKNFNNKVQECKTEKATTETWSMNNDENNFFSNIKNLSKKTATYNFTSSKKTSPFNDSYENNLDQAMKILQGEKDSLSQSQIPFSYAPTVNHTSHSGNLSSSFLNRPSNAMDFSPLTSNGGKESRGGSKKTLFRPTNAMDFSPLAYGYV